MKKKQQAAPEFITRSNGQQLVHVALANTDQRATLNAEDFQRWLAAGFSPFWSFASTGGRFQYVLANIRSPRNCTRTVPVARWIADAGNGKRVRYVDGDRLNLRRDNLAVVKGGGGANTAAAWLKPNDGTPPRRNKDQGSQTATLRLTDTPRGTLSAESYTWRRTASANASDMHTSP